MYSRGEMVVWLSALLRASRGFGLRAGRRDLRRRHDHLVHRHDGRLSRIDPQLLKDGIRVLPNFSNAAFDVQTSNTTSLSFGPIAEWYERPAGLPAPAFFNNLMHSSYFAADIPAAEK